MYIILGNCDFGGIGVVEVLWKTMTVVINRHIGAVFQFHGVPHGLRAGRERGLPPLKPSFP